MIKKALKKNIKRQKLLPRRIVVCHISYKKRKEEKHEATSETRQERRNSGTRTNDHKFEGLNRRR